ncbi:peptidoglycan editing factor PgeF [Clostridium sp. YIM B02515]|uniref:Purine nucleoside phosphorylase n=1 Tax=Clostridium rhizosphaerae TaxID=2803861 RepID=A0ABS1T6K7_9CLOT|nr:peptidoglycan editing factor PgeF [Clostridium rhizosphaerae]
MEHILIKNYDFITTSCNDAKFVFSTAKENLNFNIKKKCGNDNLLSLKEWFNVSNIGYLNQIHSNLVYDYDGKVYEGDALITNEHKVAIGVFTADCVPILIYDKKKNVVAAVHSGWKGTIGGIVINTIIKMEKDYNSFAKDLVVYIGPHNRECCYEIGEDLAALFNNYELFKDEKIIINNKLNLEKCIITQLLSIGVLKENINSLKICTFCDENISLHSYRKEREQAGRMFSFVYLI